MRVPDSPVFDKYGMLDGPDGRQVWEQLCSQLEGEFHLIGWGQPARLFALTSPSRTLDRHGSAEIAAANAALDASLALTGPLGEEPTVTGAGDGVMEFVELRTSDDALDAVWGATAPPDVPAVLMVWEEDGWLGPPATVRITPPQPIRYVSLVTRAGRQVTVARAQGHSPRVAPGTWHLGLAGTALRRVVAAPCPPPPFTVAHWLGRSVLAHAAPGLLALDQTWTPGEEFPLSQTVARDLHDTPPREQQRTRQDIARQVTEAALALVVLLASSDADPGAGRVTARARAMAVVGAADARSTAQLRDLARAVSRRTWADILGDQTVTAVLPGTVTDHRHWCDPALVGWVLWAGHPPQAATLGALRDATGPRVVEEVTDLLADVGFLEDALTLPPGQ